MVRSRSRFLERGHFVPLAERLVEIVGELVADRNRPIELLDAGCGDGYFLSRLRQDLAGQGISIACWGIDISRPAIRAAARRDPALGLAVASVHRLPVESGSLDVVLRVLAPADAAEFRRALKPEGRLIAVTPGPAHLLALRELVYDSPRAREAEPAPAGFQLLSERTFRFPLRLSSPEAVADLLAMTPYYWHLRPESRAAIAERTELKTTAEFVVASYDSRGLS